MIRTRRPDALDSKKIVNKLIILVAILEPIITIPQAYQIFRDRSAAGVSITSWIGYELFTIIWLWYGIIHKDKAITISSLLYAIVQLAVILGAVFFGGKWW